MLFLLSREEFGRLLDHWLLGSYKREECSEQVGSTVLDSVRPTPSLLSFPDSRTQAQTAEAQGIPGDSDASCFLGYSDRGMETAWVGVHGLRQGPGKRRRLSCGVSLP